MSQDRRSFFQSLVAGGATVSQREQHRNRRVHHAGERIYHGPMEVPARIAGIIADHPVLKMTTHRQLVSRYAGDADGWVWLFRCQIPEHRLMVGEIVRTPEGRIRVHCWHAADPERYTAHREPAQIVEPRPIMPRPIMPRLMASAHQPVWMTGPDETPAEESMMEYEEFVDPKRAEDFLR